MSTFGVDFPLKKVLNLAPKNDWLTLFNNLKPLNLSMYIPCADQSNAVSHRNNRLLLLHDSKDKLISYLTKNQPVDWIFLSRDPWVAKSMDYAVHNGRKLSWLWSAWTGGPTVDGTLIPVPESEWIKNDSPSFRNEIFLRWISKNFSTGYSLLGLLIS